VNALGRSDHMSTGNVAGCKRERAIFKLLIGCFYRDARAL